MTYVVTGCAGFIGSHLCERLIERGESVIGVDSFTDYYAPDRKRQNLSGLLTSERFRLVETDLASGDAADWLQQAECVFHTAGQPGVRGSWGDQFDLYLRNNVHATQRLLETIRRVNPEIRVVYSSSSSVYGNTDQLPTTETALPQPYSPYGATKLAAEHLCMLYHANYGIPVVALRYFTVYGPRQRPDMAFHLFLQSILQGKPIRILGDGRQTRDFTYVQDIVSANLAAAEKPVAGRVFNLGGGSRVSVNEVLDKLRSLSGVGFEVEYRERTRGDVRDTSADTTRAREDLGYSPSVSLEDGLRAQLDWCRSLYPAVSASNSR